MKRSLLTMLVSALVVSGVAQATEVYNKDGNVLDLYGVFKGSYIFANKNNPEDRGDASFARLGVKGTTQISQDLIGYGQWEMQYNLADSESTTVKKGLYTRLGFAGLKYANMGSFDYGRNYAVLYDVASYTDVFPVFGGDSYERNDNFLAVRASNLATYRNKDFFGMIDGLSIALQYQGENNQYHSYRKLTESNGEGYGISANYDIGMGISLASAYSNSRRTADQIYYSRIKDKKANAWTAGLKYDANSVYLAASYAETKNMTPYTPILMSDSDVYPKAVNYELVAQYQFDFGLKPSLGYVQSTAKHLDKISSKEIHKLDVQKYVDVGAYYSFNKHMTAFVDYKINLLKDKDFVKTPVYYPTDNLVGIALSYKF